MESLKDVIIFGIMLLMLSIILVQAGVHIDYVGLGVMIFLTSCILVVKLRPKWFWKYINMRENHRRYNREQLGIK